MIIPAKPTSSHYHANKVQLDLVTDGDHDVRTDNPHGVTTTQIGAVPTTRQVLSGTGLTGGGDLSADRTFALTGQALALHNLALTWITVRTGVATVTTRTITGTSNQVTVTNGDGVSGNPTLSLPQNIHTGATPTFAGLDLTGITDNYVPYMSASGLADSPIYVSSGNVGINTSTVNGKCHIASDMADYPAMNSYAPLEITGVGGNLIKRLALGYCTGTGIGFIQALTNLVSYDMLMLNPRGGYVGINTTAAPQQHLEVNGGARIGNKLHTS